MLRSGNTTAAALIATIPAEREKVRLSDQRSDLPVRAAGRKAPYG
jgi:hypothetical protein